MLQIDQTNAFQRICQIELTARFRVRGFSMSGSALLRIREKTRAGRRGAAPLMPLRASLSSHSSEAGCRGTCDS